MTWYLACFIVGFFAGSGASFWLRTLADRADRNLAYSRPRDVLHRHQQQQGDVKS